MLKAILIDDEQECLNSLQYDLKAYCPEIEVCGTALGGKDGIKAINKHKPDVVFLDIAMPHINGFDLLEMVSNIDFEVIFTTAYDQYAVQAFKISAVDYLLKPIEQESLIKAVQKVVNLRTESKPQQKIDFLIEQIKDLENNSVRKVALPTFDGLEFINLKDIIYCQSDGAYSNVYFVDGGKLYISKTLRYLEDALCDFQFFRVHNSYIVNLDYIKKYSRTDGGLLIMNNDTQIKVSRSKKEKLLNLF